MAKVQAVAKVGPLKTIPIAIVMCAPVLACRSPPVPVVQPAPPARVAEPVQVVAEPEGEHGPTVPLKGLLEGLVLVVGDTDTIYPDGFEDLCKREGYPTRLPEGVAAELEGVAPGASISVLSASGHGSALVAEVGCFYDEDGDIDGLHDSGLRVHLDRSIGQPSESWRDTRISLAFINVELPSGAWVKTTPEELSHDWSHPRGPTARKIVREHIVRQLEKCSSGAQGSATFGKKVDAIEMHVTWVRAKQSPIAFVTYASPDSDCHEPGDFTVVVDLANERVLNEYWTDMGFEVNGLMDLNADGTEEIIYTLKWAADGEKTTSLLAHTGEGWEGRGL